MIATNAIVSFLHYN